MSKLLVQSLAVIQQSLKAPKGQNNTFGKYKYRNCEDILEAVKPLLGELALFINDDIVLVGDRYYVKATVTLTDGEASIHNTAYARESLSKKGMDDSQVTGSTSSYARKYAMNGMFCIDDTKDADSFEGSKQQVAKSKIDIAAVAKQCGWTNQQVCESFTPPLNSIKDVADLEACAAYLRSNKI
tara:strand:- start:531 stop:1082 length:552 start_codon:yes stop_codon:yes gene_type:complete